MSAHVARRRAGLLIPLFSGSSTNSWGIGDIGDLAPLTAWLEGAGQRVLQLLPLNEMAPGQQSPYTAVSAMAIDPILIRMSAVEEWMALGGDACLSSVDRARLAHVRKASRVEYATIRGLKQGALSAAFDRFYAHEWRRDTDRANALRNFVSGQQWWIDDHALFRAIRAREAGRPWAEWPEPLRRHEPEALNYARRVFERDVLFHQYLQWIANTQWQAARTASHARGIELFGDLPFMVDADSADVWAYQHCFRLDDSVGAPPDAFSATGQDWGMPVYDWEVLAHDGFRWLRDRARRSADLYDGYRIDHVVGFYRTYGRPRAGGEPYFTPAQTDEQVALGEKVLGIFKDTGAEIIAEDLGTVPDFVRASMAALDVPGFRILRWERRWHEKGRPFLDPIDYPANSVAASGTHDTEPLMVWWADAADEERSQLSRLPTIQRLTQGAGLLGRLDASIVRDALLEALFASGSELLLIPLQDVFGWDSRINEPATVTPENWTFRLPWPCDRLDDVPEARERQVRLRAWAAQYQRL